MADRLLGRADPYSHPREFQADLAGTRQRPTELTRARRAAHLALLTLCLGLGVESMLLYNGSFALGQLTEGLYTLVAAAPHYRASASVVAVRSEKARTTVRLLGVGSVTGHVTGDHGSVPVEAEVSLLNVEGVVAVRCRTGSDGGSTCPGSAACRSDPPAARDPDRR